MNGRRWFVTRWGLLLFLMAAAACGAPGDPPTSRKLCPVSADLESRVDIDVGTSGDPSYPSIAVSRDVAIVGSMESTRAGGAWIYRRRGGTWIQEAKIAPDDPGTIGFGAHVAIDGDTAAVAGAILIDGTEVRTIVYVFTRRGGAWRQQAAIDSGIDYGGPLALQRDRLLIGEERADAVLVLRRRGGAWSREATLVSSDHEPFDRFGDAIAIDNDIIAVGAAFHQHDGAAYVFERRGADWIERAKLSPPPAVEYTLYGTGVSVSGHTLAVGAAGGAGSNRGAAYVYDRRGDAWVEQAKIVPSDGATDDRFGAWVSLDGDTLAIGAPGKNEAYVFTGASGGWEEVTTLSGAPGEVAFGFGEGVSLSGDTVGVFGFIPGVTTRLLGSLYLYRLERAPCDEREAEASPP